MSYRIKDDIERSTKEILINKYINPFDAIAKRTGDWDNWLDVFLHYCGVEALSEGQRPTLDNIYKLNVRPLSLKTGIHINFDDLRASYDSLVSRGYIKRTESVLKRSQVSMKAIDKAFRELIKAGLAEQHPTEEAIRGNERFKDIQTQMTETVATYLNELGNEIIRSQNESKPTYISTGYIAKNIIERFIGKYKVIDKRILMGILGGTTESLMDTIPLALKQMGKDLTDEDYLETFIFATLASSLVVYTQTKIPIIISTENIFRVSRNEMSNMLESIKNPNLSTEEEYKRLLQSIAMQFEREER